MENYIKKLEYEKLTKYIERKTTEEEDSNVKLHKLPNFELNNTYKLNTEQLQRVSDAKMEYPAGVVISEEHADEAID